MDADNEVNHDDPQFVKVLETCLKMEIAVAKEKLETNQAEIRKLKSAVLDELNRRKQLKEKMKHMHNIWVILSNTLTKLYTNIKETSETLEVMKANADDQYKLVQLKSEEYEEIITEYRKTWETYHAVYEEFPLSKVRNVERNKLEKLKIEYMVMTFKKKEMITIIKQRKHIDWIRKRCKIIEFATVMVERLKLQEKLTKLKINMKYYKKELRSIEMELQVLHKNEEDQQNLRKQKVLEMGPPKIYIPYRKMCSQNETYRTVRHQWRQVQKSFEEDTESINTLALEELCINESTTGLLEEIDIKAIKDNNSTLTAAETKEASNFQNTIVSEKSDMSVALVASDAEASAEKAALTDNDVEMKETHQEETQKSQESVKAQPSSRTKENPLKHSATTNTQDEIEAKRIRLQRENSEESSNKITALQSPPIVTKIDLKSQPSSVPKIHRIESVNYNVTPITSAPRSVQHMNFTKNSMFSPMHYEFCNSNISTFDHDFISNGDSQKGPSSLYEDSVRNYKLSSNSNISNISPVYIEENAQMASPPKHTLQQDNKYESDDKISSFQFNMFMNKKKDDFTLF